MSPLYQTKAIAGILEPVAQQVSKLIILHEEGEDGNEMPDLEKPVEAVSMAVENLVKVGKETVCSSKDEKLKLEMPKALDAIAKASSMLEHACHEMKLDPFSQKGRDHLITGSRGILQGTTKMLMCFDESQVRQINEDCSKVLNYLANCNVINSIEDLVQLVKNLSPYLSRINQGVENRRNDLLNSYYREALGNHLEQVKTLAPILICSIKILIQIVSQQGEQSTDEAVENRNYLTQRLSDEISEIMKVLKETTKTNRANISSKDNEHEMTFCEVLKKVQNQIQMSKLTPTTKLLIDNLIEKSYKIGDCFDGRIKTDLIDICKNLNYENRLMTAEQDIDQIQLRHNLYELIFKLKSHVDEAVIYRVIHDMADVTLPLKQFTEYVICENTEESLAEKQQVLDVKGRNLKLFSNKLSKTANIVSLVCARNRQRATALQQMSRHLIHLTPQLINAGRIRINHRENTAVDENFKNLHQQLFETINAIRDFCDDSINMIKFLRYTEIYIKTSIEHCKEAIQNGIFHNIIDHATLAAKLSNRLLIMLWREMDNSDDKLLLQKVNTASENLKASIKSFIENSRAVAESPFDNGIKNAWKSTVLKLMQEVSGILKIFDDEMNIEKEIDLTDNVIKVPEIPPPIPPPPQLVSLETNSLPPPRPPLPDISRLDGRHPQYTTPLDTEDEYFLQNGPLKKNRPLQQAAHGLFEEVKQWDHTDNEIIAAAKRIACLMSHLSELIRGGSRKRITGKRELIACAKSLAEASNRITELAKQLAKECTDKKIRKNLLQVCEKIPTMAKQLSVMTTVKATMIGNGMDTDHDLDAMGMIIYNAQNLNEAVKETVRAAESASIRVRSDAGFKLKWIRKQPYSYK